MNDRFARSAAGLLVATALLLAVAALAPSLSRRGAASAEGGAAREPAPIVLAPREQAPARLSETGLYLADGTVDPRNRPFAPQYPLWTDGAEKSRWVRLPEGARIDVSDIDAWRFPAGTTVWKEFAWKGRKVETRMIRAEADGRWTFATYVWNEEQTDAVLAPDEGVPAAFEVAAGKRHSIPGTQDCLSCHGSAPAALLGFSALQLSDDRDPLAPHAEPLPRGAITLRALVREGRLNPPRADLAANPPRIRAGSEIERAALGYLSGNCGSCHNPRGPLARLGFTFLHEVGREGRAAEPAVVTALGTRTRFAIPGAPDDSSQVLAPGAPDRSAALYRMGSRRRSSQMPPLGTVMADEHAVQLVRQWIESLGSGAGPVGARMEERGE